MWLWLPKGMAPPKATPQRWLGTHLKQTDSWKPFTGAGFQPPPVKFRLARISSRL
jgi:hypothetical protein